MQDGQGRKHRRKELQLPPILFALGRARVQFKIHSRSHMARCLSPSPAPLEPMLGPPGSAPERESRTSTTGTHTAAPAVSAHPHPALVRLDKVRCITDN